MNLLFFAGGFIAGLLCAANACHAHDQYSEWRTENNGSCCLERVEHNSGMITGDCRPTRARYMDDHWEAWNGQVWLRIPAEAMAPIAHVPVHTEDGRSHLCEMNGRVYCFVPSEPKS